MSSNKNFTIQPQDIESLKVYSVLGSHYVGKVLTALQSRKISYEMGFLSLSAPPEKVLPSGGKNRLVPEVLILLKNNVHIPEQEEEGAPQNVIIRKNYEGTEQTAVVLWDSEFILQWLDDHLVGFPSGKDQPLYPKKEEVLALSNRASDGVLAGAVWYYLWVPKRGYYGTQVELISRMMGVPSWVPSFLYRPILGLLLSSYRKTHSIKAQNALNLPGTESGKPLALADGPAARKALVDELAYFQTFLQPNRPFLFGQKIPTAADCAIYALMERITGDMGDMEVVPAYPELQEETMESLGAFWEWYNLMRKEYPIQAVASSSPL